MTKKFTMLQLFSILDGRLSTEIGDVYEMLNHITGDSLMTHHLPVAMDYLKEVNPKWFQELKAELEGIKKLCGNDFQTCMNVIKESYNTEHEIPQLSDEEKSGFGKYMIDNSLLLKKLKTA